jgi:hypothetical protein
VEEGEQGDILSGETRKIKKSSRLELHRMVGSCQEIRSGLQGSEKEKVEGLQTRCVPNKSGDSDSVMISDEERGNG